MGVDAGGMVEIKRIATGDCTEMLRQHPNLLRVEPRQERGEYVLSVRLHQPPIPHDLLNRYLCSILW